MESHEVNSVTVRALSPRGARKNRRSICGNGRLFNLSRAAQLLGLAYDTVAKAAEDKDLEVEFEVEGTNARPMPVVTASALEAYRKRALARLEMFSSEYHKKRAKALAEKVIE